MVKYPATLIMRGFRNWLQDDDVHEQLHRNKIINRGYSYHHSVFYSRYVVAKSPDSKQKQDECRKSCWFLSINKR